MKNNQNVSIVILTYKTKDVTDLCIAKARISAAYAQKKLGSTIEIIVVDNASGDGTVEMIRNKYKEVTLSEQKTNLGVSKGYNIGMGLSNSPFILLLNSDLYLEKDSIYNSLQYLSSNPNTDILVCKLIDATGEEVNSGGFLPTPIRTIRWLLGIDSVPLLRRMFDPIYADNVIFYEKKIEWVATCFFFLRREVYELTGGYDEKLFLYMEDVEWGKRIKDHNMKISFEPTFQVTHLCGMSAEKQLPSSHVLNRQIDGVKYYQKKILSPNSCGHPNFYYSRIKLENYILRNDR